MKTSLSTASRIIPFGRLSSRPEVGPFPGQQIDRTRWRFALSCRDAWDAMYADCAAASSTIDCEQYFFEAKGPGARFLDLFERKVGEGVRVRLLFDMIGSRELFRSDRAAALRRAGVELVFFNPIVPWRGSPPLGWVHRDHSKILVVDGAAPGQGVAHLGGVCVAERMATWRDTQVRIEGPILRDIQNAFDAMFDRARGVAPGALMAPRQGRDDLWLVTNSHHLHRNAIYRQMLDAIGRARRYVWLTTPYFIPDGRFLETLKEAAERGVEVRLLATGMPDRLLVDCVGQSFYTSLLRAGGRVHRYDGMIHAKSVVVDDEWATVGSANLDYLSFFRNYEANLVAADRRFVAELKAHFLADLERARPIALPAWRRRPFKHQAIGVLGRTVKKFL